MFEDGASLAELGKQIAKSQKIEENPLDYFDDKRFVSKRLGDELLSQNFFITKNDTLYFYENGVYKPALILIKSLINEKLIDLRSISRINETIDYLKTSTASNIKELPVNYLNLENGLYNIETNELEPHNPGYFTITQIPVNFNPDSLMSEFPIFLEQVINKEDIDIIQEWFGYCLLRNYPIHKAMMLIGDGANGKSTLINILKSFTGASNCSKIPLQNLDDRFAVYSLYGKLVNCYADLSSSAFRNTGVFKILTGQDEISAEQKFVQERLEFTNYAKLIFSCNRLPQVHGDDSDAFFRRWIIINFPNKFEGEKADPDIANKFNNAQEMSALLNWALAGLYRLKVNNAFNHSKSTDDLRQQYNRLSSPVKAFFMDRLEFSGTNHIIKKQLFAEFVKYCLNEKLPVCSQDRFFKDIVHEGNCLFDRITIEGKKEYVITGFKYKEDGLTEQLIVKDDKDNVINLENYL